VFLSGPARRTAFENRSPRIWKRPRALVVAVELNPGVEVVERTLRSLSHGFRSPGNIQNGCVCVLSLMDSPVPVTRNTRREKVLVMGLQERRTSSCARLSGFEGSWR